MKSLVNQIEGCKRYQENVALDEEAEEAIKDILVTNIDQELVCVFKLLYFPFKPLQVVGKPFHQLFSIHAFINHAGKMKYVTVAYVVMSRRQKKDYIAVFQYMRSLMQQPLRLGNVVADFKSGIFSLFLLVLTIYFMKFIVYYY